MEIILGVKVTVIIVKTKKPCFGYLSTFVTRPLALRVRNTYIYVFRAFFGFFNYQATSCSFQKLTVRLFHSPLHFEQKQPRRHNVIFTMKCFAAAQQTNTPKLPAFYKTFQTEERALRVNEAKITIETFFFMEIILVAKVTMNKVTRENLALVFFCRFVIRPLVLIPRNTYMYVFPAFFGFFTFYAISCCFQKVKVDSILYALNSKQKEH